MRMNSLVLRLACAGLATLIPAQPVFADLPTASAIARVFTDSDANSPDDLVVTLHIAASERIADIILREDGLETSLLGRFQAERTNVGTVILRLQPALDFDHLKGVKATLKVLIEPAANGSAREILLPVAIEAASVLAAPVAAKLAVQNEADTVPVLPLDMAGNARVVAIERLFGGEKHPAPYTLATADGSQVAVVQAGGGVRLGEPLYFEITRELSPSGKKLSQSVTLTPTKLEEFNRTLDADLALSPDAVQPVLTFTLAAAPNLAVEDLLLAGTSVAAQFERAATPSGDIAFSLKTGQLLADLNRAGQTVELEALKRLNGGEAATQTIRVTVRGGATANQANGASTGTGATNAGKAANVGKNSFAGLPAGTGAAAYSAATAAPLQVASQFPQPEPPQPVERRPRDANRFAASGPVTQFRYDANGNLTQIVDPLGRATAYAYDRLNRPTAATDPAGGQTRFGYDGLSQLVSVTDPRNLTTRYTLDGLGNLSALVSPDSGTSTHTHNVAGQIASRTDAAGQTTAYTYDALGRLIRATYQDGSSANYTFDQGSNGAGRLARIDERGADGLVARSQRLEYDSLGRILSDTRNIAGADYVTAYRYAQGRLTGLTYPSGRRIDYGFDGIGRISEIRLTDQGQTKMLAANIAYRPFGGILGYRNGAGRTLTRSYDQDGRIVGIDLGEQKWQISVDAASRITALTDTASPPKTATYGYDALDRLTQATLPGATLSYTFDANGNRTAMTTGSTSHSYAIAATSNRLTAADGSAYTHDANGSITGDGARQFAYDPRGRLTRAILDGTTTFEVNALGQRVRKTNGSEDRIFVYDIMGRIIAETAPDGGNARDYVWLGGLPVAVVQ